MSGKMIAFVAALATIISIVVGGVIGMENRFAHCQDLQRTDKRVDLILKTQKRDAMEQRYWKFEEKYGVNPTDPLIKQDMKEQKAAVDRESKEIELFGVAK